MIISASRRTDIPAYYSEWFLNRLKAGYVLIRNPIISSAVYRIELNPKIVNCIVFWTKDAANILDKLDELYGVEKEGFYHHEPWQLLLAIMLSAQSTDKQVDEAIPALFEHYRTAASRAAAPRDEIAGYIRSPGRLSSKTQI